MATSSSPPTSSSSGPPSPRFARPRRTPSASGASSTSAGTPWSPASAVSSRRRGTAHGRFLRPRQRPALRSRFESIGIRHPRARARRGDPGGRFRPSCRRISALLLRQFPRANRGGHRADRTLLRGEGGMKGECFMCARLSDNGPLFVADLPSSRVYFNEDQFFPGWVFVVLKRHAVELYDLDPGERAALIEDVTRVAQALARVYRPVKMNYELLGNLVPHIHWNLVARP